jgi:hypothetical protein
MSSFPSKLDTAAELPGVTNNITEIGSEAINAIREAIFAIEATLGTDVQGTERSLKDRLDAVLNPDGTFKSAALVAAGLIALPITNSMVAPTAAIEESKLDLVYSTQNLYNLIASNDIDIAALQNNVNLILANFLTHISGAGFKHDGYQILLETAYPTTPPPNISPLNVVSVSQAIFALKDMLFDHTSTNKIGAHPASAISLDTSGLSRISSTDLQGAIGELETLEETFFVAHRDDLHANGFSNFANERNGHGVNRQLLPPTYGSTVQSYILSDRRTVQFDGYSVNAFGISPGDVVRFFAPSAAIGVFTIEGIGPRAAIGSRPALTSNQISLAEHIPYDGYADAAIFTPSSTSTLKGNMAPTIHQSDIRVDSIQVSRSNAAKVLSLGLNTRFIDPTHVLGIELGVGPGLSRTITIDNLHYDRNFTVMSPPTIDSLVERLNHVLQNRTDGNAFPVAAYKVGEELLLSHNWAGSDDYYLKIDSSLSAPNTLYVLGLDGYGAAVDDIKIYPTQSASFYVNGERLYDVASILTTTANVMGQVFTFPNGENPLALGVKVGHLLHLKTHTNTSELGTYFITGVNASSVTIHKNAGITTENGVSIEVLHDAVPLDDIQNYTSHTLVEMYYDVRGRAGYVLRADYAQVTNVTNSVRIIDISDNFAAGTDALTVAAVAGGRALAFGSNAANIVPNDFSGSITLRDASYAATATIAIQSPIVGTGTISLNVYPHSLEEEVLELCSVWFDGTITLKSITDRRLFGTTGLDELREDVVQAYSELPLRELRADGVVSGFDAITINYTDAESITGLGSNVYGVLFRGGTAYVNGVRSDIPTQPIFFPQAAASYCVYATHLGTLQYLEIGNTIYDGKLSFAEVIDGYAGRIAPLAIVTHTGSGPNPLSLIDVRYFINEIDYKLDFILDTTNRRIGTFASYEAAEQHINSTPFDDNLNLRVVSNDTTYPITISAGSKDYSLLISGSVGNIEVNSDIRIESNTTPNRSRAHIASLQINNTCNSVILDSVRISGTVVGNPASNSVITFRNVTFDGAFSLTSIGTVIFDSCIFSSTSSISSYINIVKMMGCDIRSSSLSLTCNDASTPSSSIANTSFRPSGNFGQLWSKAGALSITGCNFYGDGVAKTLILLGNINITASSFTNVVASSGNIITAGSPVAPETDATISNSTFYSVVLSGTAKLFHCNSTEHLLNVDNCVFDDCNFSNNTIINASLTKFLNNRGSMTGLNLGITGTSGMVCGNTGLSSAQFDATPAGAARLAREISGNTFVDAAIGFNVYVNSSASNRESVITIANNYFVRKLLIDQKAGRITITGNIFTGTATNGCGIDFSEDGGGTEPIFITGNSFEGQTAMTFSADKGPLIITDNVFETGINSNTIIRLGANSVFSNNSYLDTSTDLMFSAASSLTRIRISGNYVRSSLRIQMPMSLCSIADNIIQTALRFDVSTTLTDCVIDGNVIETLYFNTGNNIYNSILSNNKIVSATNSSSAVWQRSIISNNILSASSAGAGTYVVYSSATGNNIIENNYFGSDVSLSAATTINDTSVIGNKFSQKTLSTSGSMDRCIIAGNSDVGMSFTSGASYCLISDNQTYGLDILLSGTILNTRIKGNNVANLSVYPITGSSGLTVTHNDVQQDLALFNAVALSSNGIDGCNITDNIITGNLKIQNSGFDAETRALNNVIIARNKTGDIPIFRLQIGGSSSYSIANLSIIENTVDGYIWMFSDIGECADVTGLNIRGNSAAQVVARGGSSIASKTFTNLDISSNVLGELALGTVNSGTNISYLHIYNNLISDAFSINGETLANISINNNTMENVGIDMQAWGAAVIYSIQDVVINGNNTASTIAFNSGTRGMARLAISGNVGRDVSFTSSTANGDLTELVMTGNKLDDVDFSAFSSTGSFNLSSISGNRLGTVSFPKLMSQVNISNNRFDTISFAASTAANDLGRLVIIGNITSQFILPSSLTVFAAAANQSLLAFNSALQWTATGGPFAITGGSTNLLAWGNTSGTASSGVLAVAGVLADSPTTANNIHAGTGIPS